MNHPGDLPLGTPLPPLNVHAITVSIPKWRDFVAYQEGVPYVKQQMLTGYPRFVIHALILQLSEIILSEKGQPDEGCILFPIANYAKECQAYLTAKSSGVSPDHVRQGRFLVEDAPKTVSVELHVVFFPNSMKRLASQFWQHTGFGISSRMAQKCLDLLEAPVILAPSRYGKQTVRQSDYVPPPLSTLGPFEGPKNRNGTPLSASQAKDALRKRIADLVSRGCTLEHNIVRDDDVFLYPAGMNAIWHVHKLLEAMQPTTRFVCFGFPYVDTLKILEKWGPGCYFLGHDPASDMNELEKLLSSSQDVPPISALFCEIPSNPRLQTPPLDRLRALADKYGFPIVCDDTVGSFVNVDVLPYVDVIATSLSKFVCGYATALGGSLIFNPRMRQYQKLKESQISSFIDTYFDEDATVMELNSRDFATRMRTVNANANALCDFLRSRSLSAFPKDATFVIKEIFYPKWITRSEYDMCRVKTYSDGQAADDNFGGLFSLTFVSPLASRVFFEALPSAKGPSLGTNFTLVCPYTILAHYAERDWAAEYGVDESLVRVSVGLEDQTELLEDFARALAAAQKAVREAGELGKTEQ